MTPYYDDGRGIVIYHGDAREIVPTLGAVDHVITDPPYSARTHAGHDASAVGHAGGKYTGNPMRSLHYASWDEADVAQYAAMAARVCDGWIVTMTDHTLSPTFERELSWLGRYVFAPVPFVAPGARVRLSGDGPSSWTIWIMVARTARLSRWGTLPGAYVSGDGWYERRGEYVGGKPLALMRALINDYSRDGETVIDPYMGSGTTLVSAKQMGRKCIGIDISEAACEQAAKRLAQEVLPLEPEPVPEQADLLGEDA